MVAKEDPILVVGGGSIGERHIGNLQRLGYGNISVLRSRNLPFRTIDAGSVRVITSWEEAAARGPKAALICSPTALHLEQAIRCAELGAHLFIEKPIAHTLTGLDLLKARVEEKNLFCFVGYMMRYHPLVRVMKEAVTSAKYGRLVSFHSHWGEYLPDWHPWEDYRESYAARSELGGGAALTLSHDLDLMLWLSGVPLKNSWMVPNRSSQLEVSAEAGADFLLEMADGSTGHVHLNYFQQPALRESLLIFDRATLHFNYFANRLEIRRKNQTDEVTEARFERNDLFVDELQDFFRQCNAFTPETSLRNIEHAAQLVAMCAAPEAPENREKRA